MADPADELIDSSGLVLRISGCKKCKICTDDELYGMIEDVKARCEERGIEAKWDSLHKTFRALRPSYAARGPATAKSLRIHVESHPPELRRLAVAAQ